ncbi:hypothetical protein N7457_000809 [Penicillium paradoxum]|uniref:uncharacterized protein n=1 Tax=Penicillium paradoxum TaxID=176176 RepID=UPI00254952BF|nr:uncharacterized protein N7457_000809 [Penicillium paradoxum]KAJ5794210.1 hypothetical protein N7457_000809 [Penicillium paradoxum]
MESLIVHCALMMFMATCLGMSIASFQNAFSSFAGGNRIAGILPTSMAVLYLILFIHLLLFVLKNIFGAPGADQTDPRDPPPDPDAAPLNTWDPHSPSHRGMGQG